MWLHSLYCMVIYLYLCENGLFNYFRFSSREVTYLHLADVVTKWEGDGGINKKKSNYEEKCGSCRHLSVIVCIVLIKAIKLPNSTNLIATSILFEHVWFLIISSVWSYLRIFVTIPGFGKVRAWLQSPNCRTLREREKRRWKARALKALTACSGIGKKNIFFSSPPLSNTASKTVFFHTARLIFRDHWLKNCIFHQTRQ